MKFGIHNQGKSLPLQMSEKHLQVQLAQWRRVYKYYKKRKHWLTNAALCNYLSYADVWRKKHRNKILN